MIKVVVGIIMKNNAVLLCQRKQTARYAMKWEFPGGKLENNEPFEQCLKRELHEELGITATVGNLFHHQHTLYPDSGSFDVFYYLVPSYHGEIENRAFASYRWVSFNNLAWYDILEGNRDVIQKLIERYANKETV